MKEPVLTFISTFIFIAQIILAQNLNSNDSIIITDFDLDHQKNIFFKNEGPIALDATGFIVTFQMNITEYQHQMLQIKAIEEVLDHLQEHFRSNEEQNNPIALLLQKHRGILVRRIQRLQGKIDLMRKLANPPKAMRPRRSLVLGVLSSLANMAFSVYLNGRLNEYKSKQDKMMEVLDLTTHQLAQHQHELEVINHSLSQISTIVFFQKEELRKQVVFERITEGCSLISSTLTLLEDMINDVTNGLISSLHGALDPRFIPIELLDRTLKTARRKIPKDLRMAIPHHPASYYKLQTHVTMDGDWLNTFVTIPVFNPAVIYRLLTLIKTPIFLQNGVIAEVETQDRSIITNSEYSLFYETSLEQLQEECERIDGLFICPNLRILRKPSTQTGSCLYFLLKGDVATVGAKCKEVLSFRINQELEITQVGHNQYLTSSPNSTEVMETCGQRIQKKTVPSGLSQLMVPSGCSVSGKTFYLVNQHNHTLAFTPLSVFIPILIPDLDHVSQWMTDNQGHGVDTTELTKSLQELKRMGHQKLYLPDLLQHMETLKHEVPTLGYSSLLLALLCLVILLCILGGLYFRYRQLVHKQTTSSRIPMDILQRGNEEEAMDTT